MSGIFTKGVARKSEQLKGVITELVEVIGELEAKLPVFMAAFVREFFPQDFLPDDLPISADGKKNKLLPMRHRHAVVRSGSAVINRRLRFPNRHC